MAFNVPLKFLKYEIDAEKNRPVMQLNENFVADIKEKFAVTDTLFLMCRSGVRSASAVNLLAAAGFKNVYSITDGFEGDESKRASASDGGKRTVSGWKNTGPPWTYELDAKLMYLPEAEP
jgi:rhodanese-related sulfurtransferase